MLFDAHIHAGMFPDVVSVVKCAQDNGITPILVGIYPDECLQTLEKLSNNNLVTPVFVGIHPWYASEHGFDDDKFAILLKSPLVKGIGECGLDNKIAMPLNEQLTLLQKHLELAAHYNLPVNLHIRGYHNELLNCLKKYQSRVVGIIHNFTFSYEIAKRYLDIGYLLSVGHFVLTPSAKLTSVLNLVGLDNIVLETDLDYLHIGQYDHNLLKKEYVALGSLLNTTTDKIELTIEKNLKNILGNE